MGILFITIDNGTRLPLSARAHDTPREHSLRNIERSTLKVTTFISDVHDEEGRKQKKLPSQPTINCFQGAMLACARAPFFLLLHKNRGNK